MGGLGLDLETTSAIARTLAQYCSSTAMTFAMHCIQVACLVNHGGRGYLEDFLRETARGQLLIASVTSEVGVGGEMRRSIAAVERHDDACFVAKQASTISYGRYADAYLLTARRSPDSEPSDQSLVLISRDQATLERTGEWDALGMRGTCSEAFKLEASFGPEAILPDAFGAIAEQTMVPVSHVLWASCWLGIAQEAFRRARDYTRAAAAKSDPAEFVLGRLAEMTSALQSASLTLKAVIEWYGNQPPGAEQTLADSIRINNLKLTVSELAQKVVADALAVTGMAGYSEASPFSVARLLRDVTSSGLMIGNDRIKRTNGAALLAVRNLF